MVWRRWTKEEDQRLREAVQALGAANWKTIAQEWLGGHRSDVQVGGVSWFDVCVWMDR